ncbi:MAG: Uma2 family endonuclease [Pirellulales bacterium]|nr:Uma2 family endonuclease [Pirellulales bacterium]
MSTVTHQPETRILIPNVSWEVFSGLAAADCAGTRFAYDQGLLEIMSPSLEHEWSHRLLGRLIEALTEELNIPLLSAGSTTLKLQLKQRGVEPDECYYLTHEAQVRGKFDLDLTVDPPPDLALEVDISRSSLDKLDIYADLGVPELWLYNGENLRVYPLQADGRYRQQESSLNFPFLDLKEIEKLMGHFHPGGETAWIRSFRDWVREQYGHLSP